MRTYQSYLFICLLGAWLFTGLSFSVLRECQAADAQTTNAAQKNEEEAVGDGVTNHVETSVNNDFALKLDLNDPKTIEALKRADKEVPADQVR